MCTGQVLRGLYPSAHLTLVSDRQDTGEYVCMSDTVCLLGTNMTSTKAKYVPCTVCEQWESDWRVCICMCCVH